MPHVNVGRHFAVQRQVDYKYTLYNDKFWAFPEFIITPSLVVKLSTTAAPDLIPHKPSYCQISVKIFKFSLPVGKMCRSEHRAESESLTTTSAANDDGSGVYPETAENISWRSINNVICQMIHGSNKEWLSVLCTVQFGLALSRDITYCEAVCNISGLEALEKNI